MKRLSIVAAVFSLAASSLSAQPAAAPAHPELDCPLEGVSAEQRALAAAAAAQRLTDAPAGGAQQGSAALETILANMPRCAGPRRWSENQREFARQYVLMQLAREDMLRRYDAQNVDLRFIDQAVAASQTGAALPFDDLVARVRAQGVGDDRPDSAGDIVYTYMMLVYQLAEIRTGFGDRNFRLQ